MGENNISDGSFSLGDEDAVDSYVDEEKARQPSTEIDPAQAKRAKIISERQVEASASLSRIEKQQGDAYAAAVKAGGDPDRDPTVVELGHQMLAEKVRYALASVDTVAALEQAIAQLNSDFNKGRKAPMIDDGTKAEVARVEHEVDGMPVVIVLSQSEITNAPFYFRVEGDISGLESINQISET